MSELFFETKLFWVTAVVVCAYLYLKYYVFNYWQRYGVPCEQPSIPLGNIPITHFFGKISIANFLKENYNKFKKNPFHGFYTFHKPAIVINDPELIKTILVKEFHRFPNRGWYYNDKTDKLSENLFLMPGEKWKKLRAKLSPVFTSGKLKQMYQLFTEVTHELINVCEAELNKSDVLEMKDLMGRYTTDIISSVVYGIKSNSLKNTKNEFRDHGIETFQFERITLLLGIFAPELMDKFNLKLTHKAGRKFFINTFKDMIDYRRKEEVERKDFLNLIMQLMDIGEVEDDEGNIINESKNTLEKLDMGQGAAQAYVFFVAGYETASSTATYALLELALNPEIQDKLREEIDQMAETTGITYDSVMGNEYLDMVLAERYIHQYRLGIVTNHQLVKINVLLETLRKHPSVPFLNRKCEKDFPIPNSNFTIPKGMRVIISTSGIHNNPDFYPDPEKFDPMHFSKENIAGRSNYVFLGFGDGPRYCIGKRFGQLQVKQAIVVMLRNYKFYISEKTVIPVKYTTKSFAQTPESGVYLRIEKRNL